MARLSLLTTLSLLALSCAHPAPRKGEPLAADLPAYEALVRDLSADAMEGRGIQTAGNEAATAYIEAAFKEAGLAPGGEGGYRQCFSQPVSLRDEGSSLSLGGAPLPAGAFAPAAFSASGAFKGELVFAGYGIHAPEAGYSDYTDLDPKGKVLLVLRYEPRESDPASPLDGAKPSRFSSLRRKVFEARSRGAAGVIFVTAPRAGETPDTQLPTLEGAEAQSDAGLPVFFLLPAQAEALLAAQGSSLAEQVAQIDATFASTPRPLGAVQGQAQLLREEATLCNVVGVLPGVGALADEAVVIGAHFDHLGYGQRGSMAPGERAIHNGADDNASGTAAVILLGRKLAAQPPEGPRRALIFLAFNAEEVGLAGSSAYVASPRVPMAGTQAMLNMDMIGRLREGKLSVLGAGSGDLWERWLAEAPEAAAFELNTVADGYGPSDQTPFYAKGVPVLHFFTGSHADYHRPSDDADLINFEGGHQIAGLVEGLARRAATHSDRVAWQATSAGPMAGGDSRGYGAWLGSVPDYSAMSPGAAGGVLLSGVSAGGPAESAGLLGGDRIVEMAGLKVETLHDMTFILRDHRPGAVIEIVVERAGERRSFGVTLGDRRARGKQGANPHAANPHAANPHAANPHAAPEGPALDPATLLFPGEERHLSNVRQLTFDGENAEAYFHPAGDRVVYQARGEGVPCDRIYELDLKTLKRTQLSSGSGRTTCAYYTWPKGEASIFASTHLGGEACPADPDHSQGYVWPIYSSYDLFHRSAEGELTRLTTSPAYDAEATVCFKDGRTVFTSTRDGDLELYLLHAPTPGAEITRLTHTPGYDGGAFFSPDCSKLVWRASRHEGAGLADYQRLLAQGLVRPSKMELFISDGEGRGARQLTHNGAANFAPYFLPDNRRVLFASNLGSPRGRNFDLYLIDTEARDPQATIERVTFSPVFESFPMFSPDGKRLIFASNRNAKRPGDTNLFIADWRD